MDTTPGVKITALPLPDVVNALRRSGALTVTEDALRKDIAGGAPVNPDGTINLIHYAAWLAKELANGRDESPRA